ncbi:MAG: class A beta-lactamase-related serine hydrolase [Nanoarchaeota archaeon]|nr:class A beta-lactamase-related serine hydrolase [Nanoarchaeota archaeon]
MSHELSAKAINNNNEIVAKIGVNDKCENGLAENLRYEIGIFIYDLTKNEILVAIQPDKPLGFASAIKGPILIYYLDTMNYLDSSDIGKQPEDIWSLPVTEWDHEQGSIETSVYKMIRLSDNLATSRVLGYVNQFNPQVTEYIYSGTKQSLPEQQLNSIELFNEWSTNIIGTSTNAGLYKWEPWGYEDYPTKGELDESTNYCYYNDYYLNCIIFPKEYCIKNLLSPRDMAKYYFWMYSKDPGDPVRIKAYDLLSLGYEYNEYGSNLHFLAKEFGGRYISKEGGDSGIEVEAGIIEIPDDNPAESTESSESKHAFIIITMATYPHDLDPSPTAHKLRELYWGIDNYDTGESWVGGDNGIIEQILTQALQE